MLPKEGYSPVRHLAKAIHPKWSKLKLMGMLHPILYADESGHPEDPHLKYSGMSGFVAPAGAWEVLEDEWKNALDNAGFSEPFHMKEFAHCKGQFSRWADTSKEGAPCDPKYAKDREFLLTRLVDIIIAAKPDFYGTIVESRAFDSLTEPQRNAIGSPFYLAFQKCVVGSCMGPISSRSMDVFDIGEPDRPIEKVAMVFAYQEEFGQVPKGACEQYWFRIKNSTNPVRHHMGSYASNTPAELIPLQAADLFSYELCHEFEIYMGDRKQPIRKMRIPLKRILQSLTNDGLEILHFDRLELLRHLMEGKHRDRTGFDEVPANQMERQMERLRGWLWSRAEIKVAPYREPSRPVRFVP